MQNMFNLNKQNPSTLTGNKSGMSGQTLYNEIAGGGMSPEYYRRHYGDLFSNAGIDVDWNNFQFMDPQDPYSGRTDLGFGQENMQSLEQLLAGNNIEDLGYIDPENPRLRGHRLVDSEGNEIATGSWEEDKPDFISRMLETVVPLGLATIFGGAGYQALGGTLPTLGGGAAGTGAVATPVAGGSAVGTPLTAAPGLAEVIPAGMTGVIPGGAAPAATTGSLGSQLPGWLTSGAGAIAEPIANIIAGRDQNQTFGNEARTLDQLFSPEGQYAQEMRRQLERRDSAGGRRSQYGPREAQLMAALATERARASGDIQRADTAALGGRNQIRGEILGLANNFLDLFK